MAILHALDRTHDLQLHVEGKRGRDPVRVDLVRRQAFRLEEDVVAVLAGKAVDLVFDRRAVARPDTLDDAGVHRRAIEIVADDVVRARIGVRHPARQLLRMLASRAEVGKDRHRIIRVLLFHHREIDALAIKPWRRARLQTADR